MDFSVKEINNMVIILIGLAIHNKTQDYIKSETETKCFVSFGSLNTDFSMDLHVKSNEVELLKHKLLVYDIMLSVFDCDRLIFISYVSPGMKKTIMGLII